MKIGKKQAIKHKKYFVFFAILFALCVKIYPQSTSAQIETLLQSDAITYAQAARLILDAANQLTTNNQEEAYQFAAERNWLPKNATQETQARLDGVSLLFMNAFEINGGLFYSITKAPHYAYRELVYRNFIQGRTAPGMNVSGELLLFIINRILASEQLAVSSEQ